MIWVVLAILVVGYFIYWAIQHNTQVNAAIATQQLESKRIPYALDLSQYEKLPVATVQSSRVPTIHHTIMAYAPKVGKWVYSLTEEYRDTMTPFIDTGGIDGGNFGNWQLYYETLFFACGYVVENLRPKLNKHEQVYMFVILAGLAMFEDPNFVEPKSDNPSVHIASLMSDTPLPHSLRKYLAADSSKKLFTNIIKDFTYAPEAIRKKYLQDAFKRLDNN